MRRFVSLGQPVFLAQAGFPTLGAPVPSVDLEPKIRAMCQVAERFGTNVNPWTDTGQGLQQAIGNVFTAGGEPLPQGMVNEILNTAMVRCPDFSEFWQNWTMQGASTQPRDKPGEDEGEEPPPPMPEGEAVPTGAGREKRCFKLPDGSYQMMYPSVAPAGAKTARQTECDKVREEEPEPEPEPTSTWEETPPGIPECYACGPFDFKRLTPAMAKARGCTLTDPKNCEPKPTPTPTPTSGIPAGGLQVPSSAPIQTTSMPTPTGIPTAGLPEAGEAVSTRLWDEQPGSGEPVSTPYSFTPEEPQPQPTSMVTPRTTAPAPTPTTDWSQQAQPMSTQYSWGGEQAWQQAEQAAAQAQCGPYEFWDGTKCRGSVDTEELQAYGSVASMGPGTQVAPGDFSVAPSMGPSAAVAVSGPRRLSRASLSPFGF